MADAVAVPVGRRAQVATALKVSAVPALVWYGALVGTGMLLGGPLEGAVSAEDGLTNGFEDARTAQWDSVANLASWSANTGAIVLGAAFIGLLLRVVLRSWLEPLLLWAGVALQSAVFLLTTLVVSRRRPEVDQLDPAPPTSSFPSGHTGASTALWLGLALVLAPRVQRRWLRVLLVAVLLLIPLCVATARLYRGMHHPSDVVFGLLNGTAAVLIVRYAVLHGHDQRG